MHARIAQSTRAAARTVGAAARLRSFAAPPPPIASSPFACVLPSLASLGTSAMRSEPHKRPANQALLRVRACAAPVDNLASRADPTLRLLHTARPRACSAQPPSPARSPSSRPHPSTSRRRQSSRPRRSPPSLPRSTRQRRARRRRPSRPWRPLSALLVTMSAAAA